jgi:hypothetical protein
LQLGQKTSVCRGSVKKGIIAIDISNVKNKSKALKQGNRKMSSEHVRNLWQSCSYHSLKDVEKEICFKDFPGQSPLRKNPGDACLTKSAYELIPHVQLARHSEAAVALVQIGPGTAHTGGTYWYYLHDAVFLVYRMQELLGHGGFWGQVVYCR